MLTGLKSDFFAGFAVTSPNCVNITDTICLMLYNYNYCLILEYTYFSTIIILIISKLLYD
ncbi:hypothetical protein A0H76_776 [Hepatospora eriocheir]|uniref:Uncharacterized protein n=1 Tax=Hepatospora eriocheir TaxID=1081669 RepID=A0A1X0QIC4_9MICR|nr:hypothetical protein A0H76_776 [Hepatospora eriocheir]